MKKIFRKTVSALLTFAVMSVSSFGGFNALAAVNGVWPTQPEYKTITTYFNEMRNVNNSSGYHNAIDIQADYNTDIYAAYPGTVQYSGWLDGYGYIVILRHDDLGVYTFYAHASSVVVSAGASVSQGQVIAKIGSTGISSGNHLHFGVSNALDATGYPTVTFYDPLNYFTFTNNTVTPANTTAGSSMSSDYAGIYNTNSLLTTYLNIRSGCGTGYSIVGKINAGSTGIRVTEADGKWAHVEFNGVTGYCSMDYLQKAEAPKTTAATTAVTTAAPTAVTVTTTAAAAAAPAVDYSGTYATKGVTTFINIRSGKGTEYSAIGKIPAHADNIKVLDGDGKWAHIEYNGVTGYCSMDYIQKLTPKESKMDIASVIAPMGQVEYKKSFSISGVISSDVNITKVWGGVYDKDDKPTAQYAEAAPNAAKYDLKSAFDKTIKFDALEKGSYIYRISAQDANGKTFELVRTEFTIGAPTQERPAVKETVSGDLNADGSVTIADGLLLQGFLLNNGDLSEAQFKASDINADSSVNVFDMILMKKLLTDNT